MKDAGLMTNGAASAGYGSLYRKMRPQIFADIIGQRHAVEALRRQVATGNIAHAYLFSGSRGTGKTSTALVFARAINCLNPRDGEPCMACENCLGASSVDVVEMDAASYNSVDDIRQLREYVKYAPAHGKKKVYIIDEVHMLSNAAFNALLKTLEEPPSHIVFILATTELHMIPATVQSRCQRYDFRRVSKDGMRAKIFEVAGRFGVDIEPAAADLIIRVADGSMRDTLALLEQALSLERPRLTESEAAEIFGVARTGDLVELVRGALLGDVTALLDRLEALFAEGVDAFELLTGLISTLRDVLVRCIASKEEIAQDDYTSAVRRIAKETTVADAERLFNKMVELSKFARYSKNKESLIEVTLLVFAAERRSDAGLGERTAEQSEHAATHSTGAADAAHFEAHPEVRSDSAKSSDTADNQGVVAPEALAPPASSVTDAANQSADALRQSASGSENLRTAPDTPKQSADAENQRISAVNQKNIGGAVDAAHFEAHPEVHSGIAKSSDTADNQGAVAPEALAPPAISVPDAANQSAGAPKPSALGSENQRTAPGSPKQSAGTASQSIDVVNQSADTKKTITYVPKTQKAEDGERRTAEELKKLWSDILAHVPESKRTLLKNSEAALFVGGELLVNIRGLSPAREMVIERTLKADVVDAAKLVTGRDCMVKFEALPKSSMENAEDVVSVKNYFMEKEIDIEIV